MRPTTRARDLSPNAPLKITKLHAKLHRVLDELVAWREVAREILDTLVPDSRDIEPTPATLRAAFRGWKRGQKSTREEDT